MTSSPVTLGIVGTGWRAEFFARLAQMMPDRFTLVGMAARRAESADAAGRAWHVPTYLEPAELQRRQRPDFVVSAVPPAGNAGVVTDLVAAGARVLTETPPAPDDDGLRALWAAVGPSRRVQVAEQYLLLPAHAARLAIVRRGVIGTPTSVQVSSTHGYHAVSMIRGILGAGFARAIVSTAAFTAPLVDPLSRAGWTDDDTEKPATTTIATIDFGDGRSGLYDFTDNQWHNQLRFRRILIRGSRGEIENDRVVRLIPAPGSAPSPEHPSIVVSELRRYQVGHDLNLDGHDTEHISFDGEVLYRNPFLGHRLMDEEIAIASIMASTGAWAREEGPAPYPLAQGCQDHLISLAINESAASGRPVSTSVGPWATEGA